MVDNILTTTTSYSSNHRIQAAEHTYIHNQQCPSASKPPCWIERKLAQRRTSAILHGVGVAALDRSVQGGRTSTLLLHNTHQLFGRPPPSKKPPRAAPFPCSPVQSSRQQIYQSKSALVSIVAAAALTVPYTHPAMQAWQARSVHTSPNPYTLNPLHFNHVLQANRHATVRFSSVESQFAARHVKVGARCQVLWWCSGTVSGWRVGLRSVLQPPHASCCCKVVTDGHKPGGLSCTDEAGGWLCQEGGSRLVVPFSP